MGTLRLSLGITVLVALIAAKIQVDRHRGVPLARKSLYEPGKDFSCLDGSETIPFAFVNDDYCDCADGSDEPGTAACPSGQFHCVNVGHTGTDIPSSRVNDGLCDCCDGSDEYGAAVTCANNCDEIGRAAREEAQRRAAAQREGFGKRQELLKEAARIKSEKEAQLVTWKAEKEGLDPEKDSLNVAKSAAESAEREAKDAHSSAWKAVQAEKTKIKATAAFAALDLDSDGSLTAVELQARPEFDKDGDGIVTAEESSYYIMGKDAVDLNTFVEDIWDGFKPIYRPGEDEAVASPPAVPTGDPHSAIPPAESLDHAPPVDVEDSEQDDDEVEDFDSEKYLAEGKEEAGTEDEEPEPEYDEATKAVIAAADAARAAFDEADRKLRDLEGDVKAAEEELGTDFGPERAFASLKGTCVEMSDSQYTYKWCPFDKATQRDKAGGHGETNLGVWGEWAGPDDDRYSAVKMSKGTSCWNGPERSTIVKLSCGVETKLLSASEPGRCEYEFLAETPAVCTDPALHHATDEL